MTTPPPPASSTNPKLAAPGTGSNPPPYRHRAILPKCFRTHPNNNNNHQYDDDDDDDDETSAPDLADATAITPLPTPTPLPTTRTLPVPWWFLPRSARLFQTLPLLSDDVVVSSGIKMGTTWMNRILSLLLHEVGDDGEFLPPPRPPDCIDRHHDHRQPHDHRQNDRQLHPHRGHDSFPNRRGQTYPEACYATRSLRDRDPDGIFSRVPDGRAAHAGIFGDFAWEDLAGQPRPRVFATHLFGRRCLPVGLFDGWWWGDLGENEDDDREEREEEEDEREKGPKFHNSSNNDNNNDNDNKGTGRLIVVLRNAKDTLASLHHFRGLPLDGWRGNHHGPGSFRRFLMVDDCPNAMGNAFLWIKENDEAVRSILDDTRDDDHTPPRALVVYYEALLRHFPSQLQRLRSFLSLPPLTPQKLSAVQAACSFSAMSDVAAGRFRQTTRKGGIGDWRRHFDRGETNGAESREFDAVFNRVLNGVGCAEPLRFFQWGEVGGLPSRWRRRRRSGRGGGKEMEVEMEVDENDNDNDNDDDGDDGVKNELDVDPTTWDGYAIVKLREGMIVPHHRFSGVESLMDVERRLVPTEFRCSERHGSGDVAAFVSPDFEETHGVDGGPRYHLFVAGSDPSALLVAMTRTLLGLEGLLSMDVADGQSGAGWVFLDGAGCLPWKRKKDCGDDNDDDEPFWLYEVYQLGDPLCTTEISVPVLWDTVEEKIVSNDSWEITKLLSDFATHVDAGLGFSPENVKDVIGKGGRDDRPTLFPDDVKEEIERLHSRICRPLIDAIETAGTEYFRHGQSITAVVSEARNEVFAKLLELERLLGTRRFATGDNLTAADIHLASCLFQYDAAYLDAYKLRHCEGCKGPILLGDSYPSLKAYLRDLYGFLQTSVHFGYYRHHFRLQKAIERTKQLYSCEVLDETSRIQSIYDKLPDLHAILESIEKPAGERPKGSTAVSSTPQVAKVEGVPVPFWFRNDSFQLFRDLDLRDDDIILSSGVKMGTTWVTKILNSLLHDFDDDGNTTPFYMDDSFPNRLGQTYPDALFPSREVLKREMADLIAKTPKGREPVASNFGDFVFDDLIHQPTPRLFSSHLFGKKLLPKQLFDGWIKEHDGMITTLPLSQGGQKGKGRLIVVVRNLKDTLTSLHFFRGEPKDGWDGNEHGPGSFRRFIDLQSCPNAYGDSFNWIKHSAEAVDAMSPDRVLVIYYEALKANFPAQLRRINDFLALPPLTEAKSRAISDACSASKMRSETGGRFKYSIRKGSIGDWVNYLDEERWNKLDRVFNKSLGGIDLAEPLRFFHYKEIPGMPLVSWQDCDLETDQRSWPPYLCVSLREGMVVPDPEIVNANYDIGSVLSSTFRFSSSSSETSTNLDETGTDGSPRYHLFLAPSDPLASPIIAALKLLGLENKVSADISDGQSSAGWAFLNGASCSPWNGREGPFWLYEAYQLADPLCTTKMSVPVLWDTVSERIVSNDSWEILKLLSRSSGSIAESDDRSLFSEELQLMIEAMFSECIGPLIDDVVRTGLEYFKNDQNETERLQQARKAAYTKLVHLDTVLGTTRYLVGDNMSAVDLYFSAFLFLFDACYLDSFMFRDSEGFGVPILSGGCYPNLTAYARDMFRLLKSSVRFESFGEVFRIGPSIAHTRQSCSSESMDALHESATATVPSLSEIIDFLDQPSGVRPAK
ncbi:hypothetical protein ACHAXS_013235 [Conticribra weissflogii]